MKRLIVAALLTTVATNVATAQTAAVAPPPLGGPLIAGVCLLSQQAMTANAKVGQAATARLKEISDLAQSEINAGRAQLNFDAKAIESQRSTLKPEEFQQKQQAFTRRLQELEQTANLRSREIEATRAKAVARIAAEAQPVIAEVYKSKNCGLLVDRNSVFGGNMANDLTPAVVQGLDGKITTITFDRENLPPPAAQASR